MAHYALFHNMPRDWSIWSLTQYPSYTDRWNYITPIHPSHVQQTNPPLTGLIADWRLRQIAVDHKHKRQMEKYMPTIRFGLRYAYSKCRAFDNIRNCDIR